MNRALDCTITPCPVSAPLIGTAIARLAGTSSGRRCDGLHRPGYRRALRQHTGRDPMIDAHLGIRDRAAAAC